MSIVVVRKKRSSLYLSITGLLVMVAAVSAVSARDPSGVAFRVGMIMILVGAGLLLSWQALIPVVLAVWVGPNAVRGLLEPWPLLNTNMLLELPGLIGIAICTSLARDLLRALEEENLLLGATTADVIGLDPDTGVFEERLLLPALEAELVRSRRFSREFALVLVGVDELRQRFDYRDDATWEASFLATAQLLRSTRVHVDRAYRFGSASFALILPESDANDVMGLIRRLRHVSRRASPAEGQLGGPLPTQFGATFFPQCATTPDDLLRRAEIALRLAEKNSNRIQFDGAEAADLPPPETLRRADEALAAPMPSLSTTPSATDAEAVAAESGPTAALSDDAAPAAEAPATGDASSPEPAPTNGHNPAAQAPYVELESPAPAPPALTLDDAEMNDLMKHLDETLGLIRALRTETPSEREGATLPR